MDWTDETAWDFALCALTAVRDERTRTQTEQPGTTLFLCAGGVIAEAPTLVTLPTELRAPLIRAAARQLRAHYVVQIHEAWTVLVSRDQPRPAGSLADHPGRREVLQMIVDGGGLRDRMATAEIQSDGRVGPIHNTPAGRATAGRIAGLGRPAMPPGGDA